MREEEKTVKKNAALLHFLDFVLDLRFGVPRGEQPLGRGSRLGTARLFRSFFGHKRESLRENP